ncbi:MAG: cell division protein FtsQ/DivIB [Chitinophagaceae bacterium]
MKINKQLIRQIFTIILWLSIGSGITLLLISAVNKEQKNLCKEVIVEFDDQLPFRMLDEDEIIYTLWPAALSTYPVGKPVTSLDIYALEKQLEKNPWIKNADIYFDQVRKLHLMVEQRNPVARLFTPAGNSFYIDDQYALLPVKLAGAVSLPVFTNYAQISSIPSAADTLLMKRIVSLSNFIKSDSLWMAQIEQVNINPDLTFDVMTQMGDQFIQLGVRSDWSKLFSKLKVLYKRINEEGNWSKYSQIDLQYKDQAVCIKRGTNYKVIDTTMQLDSTLIQLKTTQKTQ